MARDGLDPSTCAHLAHMRMLQQLLLLGGQRHVGLGRGEERVPRDAESAVRAGLGSGRVDVERGRAREDEGAAARERGTRERRGGARR